MSLQDEIANQEIDSQITFINDDVLASIDKTIKKLEEITKAQNEGKKLTLEEKIAANTWDHLHDFLKVYIAMLKGEWVWYRNPNCKYVNLRVDMRDGGCIIADRDDNRIDPKDLEKQ